LRVGGFAAPGRCGDGTAHGDLSPFNLLVHRGRLVLIDLPQVVDIVANPQGPAFLTRDLRIITDWFTAHGLPQRIAGAGARRVVSGKRQWFNGTLPPVGVRLERSTIAETHQFGVHVGGHRTK
jgi:serine/threonine-protein kinase RIO1